MHVELLQQPTMIPHCDEVDGVDIRLDAELPWVEWRTWLRPLLDEDRLQPYGIDLSRTESISVVDLGRALPRISGGAKHDEARVHYLFACEMQRGFVLCLPITIIRKLDLERLLSRCGPDEAAPPINLEDQTIWSPQFQVIVHYTVAELVKHFELRIDERLALRALLEPRLSERSFARIAPALEYRN